MKTASCFGPAHILLPGENIPLEKWGCVACDQFTSDRAYWEQADAVVGGCPSTLRLILPEVYLEDKDAAQRVENIHAAMDEYSRDVLTRAVDGFVYVERTEQSGRVRQGLVGKIDLEAYSYEKGARPAIRPSERTVTERIPPRMAVRRGAALETPHVMMLADDPGCTLVEPIGAHKSELKKLYEGELMQGGGHIAGWAVEDPAMLAQIDAALAALGSQEAFDARYPQARGAAPLTLAVGDGNHSLAAAKACWEELKATLTPEERESHPARWCLAEVCNVHSPAIEIEPIHRVLFNADCGAVLLALLEWSNPRTMGGLSVPGKIMAALFQSVSTRTAGMNTIDLAACSPISKLLMSVLQFIGAAPGSTGGGVKVTTFAVLILTIRSVAQGRDDCVIGGHHIESKTVYRALTIIVIGAVAAFGSAVVVYYNTAETVSVIDCIFESCSAFGTVGLSVGVTGQLNTGAKLLYMACMFMGRVGPVSLAISLTAKPDDNKRKVLPVGHINVG